MIYYYELLDDGTIGKYTTSMSVAAQNGWQHSTEEKIISDCGKSYLESDYLKIIQTEEYIKKQKEIERRRLDSLTLTPADVERALYKAKGIDFEDVKFLLKDVPDFDMKALGIELRANLFYRGSVWVNKIAELIGYTPEDMDYLFVHKELPAKNSEEAV